MDIAGAEFTHGRHNSFSQFDNAEATARSQQLLRTVFTKLFSRCVSRFGDAVGEKYETIAAGKLDLILDINLFIRGL